MPRLLVINPNSNTTVTANIDRALDPWRVTGVKIDCVTNDAGPDTISSDEDAQRAGRDVCAIAAKARADAILVACFSDPGVDMLRGQTARPVFGIQECAILTALARAPRYGIIALSERAVPRHRARIEKLGLTERFAGELGLSGYSALAVGQSDAAYAETRTAADRLRGLGAGAVVLGCAGFGPRRAALEADLGMPVIDPVLAGAAIAVGALLG
ncbi:aspartate/glutamate racemase family protein [Paenirhodobacter populi]|uniref:Asp/Glu/hydantoin racemase n=1 Tax=Paenirhodobacter populi TaxID=2306993 RepID=A0A443JLG8_9RHOB|nr:aspartate/glutamate racemase family protein [Sinirhodobacter populi]RWR21429.1 Asp/Glu/hydantoin racemase [Sinirhodobacter populi]